MIFDNWLNETNNNISRLEEIYNELVLQRYIDNHSFWNKILRWLKAAYLIGYISGKAEMLNLFKITNHKELV